MRTAFLFSGQGAQYPGMMKDIAEQCPEAKAVFDTADRSLGRSISHLCFSGEQEELNLTHNTQPCVLAADLAAYRAIRAADIKPEAVGGFSLGEYAALAAAGVIGIEDAFLLVQKRADYMQEAVPVGKGSMAAIMKQTAAEVEQLCGKADGYVVPANYNCPGQIVISGETEAVDRILEIAKERKIRAMKLAVSAPFHCRMMEPAVERLKGPLSSTAFSSPSVPVYMNVDARPERETEQIRKKLLLQAMSPVRWEETLRNMSDAGIDTFVELGPGRTLAGFVKKTLGEEVRCFSVTDIDTLNRTINELRG